MNSQWKLKQISHRFECFLIYFQFRINVMKILFKFLVLLWMKFQFKFSWKNITTYLTFKLFQFFACDISCMLLKRSEFLETFVTGICNFADVFPINTLKSHSSHWRPNRRLQRKWIKTLTTAPVHVAQFCAKLLAIWLFICSDTSIRILREN